MAGTEARKEKSAAVSRSAPASIPAAMVAPEREMPGITASPCTAPTSSAHGQRASQPERGGAVPRTRRAAISTAAVTSSITETKRGARGRPTDPSAKPMTLVTAVHRTSSSSRRRSEVSCRRRRGGRSRSAAAAQQVAQAGTEHHGGGGQGGQVQQHVEQQRHLADLEDAAQQHQMS